MISYHNKLILAPMVRISSLPMRLLALDYGADIVYSEEIIDHKMLQCEVIKNELLETTDFFMPDGTIVFRTCAREKNSLIFQVGTSNADRAVEVANMVKDYVSGFDVNMGCPKEFSIKGGMGVALMSNRDKAKEILSKLVSNSKLPISCKTRISESLEESIAFTQMVESCGVSCVAIHGRTKVERPQHRNHNDVISAIVAAVSIPVIANGGSNEIEKYEDIEKFKLSTGCSSVMLARVAQWNPSIFSKKGLRPLDEVIRKYLGYCIEFDNNLANVKYCIQQFLHEELKSELGQKLLATNTLREICCLWQMETRYDDFMIQLDERRKLILDKSNPNPTSNSWLQNNSFEVAVKYNRRDFEGNKSPKMVLYEWAIKEKLDTPQYEIINNEETRLFRCSLSFNGCKFISLSWDKSKKNAEQASTIICLNILKEQHLDKPNLFSLPPPPVPYRTSLSPHLKSSKEI